MKTEKCSMENEKPQESGMNTEFRACCCIMKLRQGASLGH